MGRKTQSSQNSARDRSQQTLLQCLDKESEKNEELVHKLVRYVLIKAGANMPLRKQEIMKNVLNSNGGEKKFQKIMDGATEVLKKVYGYKIDLIEATAGSKIYAVTNMLEPIPSQREDLPPIGDSKKIIALLILTHTFMSNNSCSETSLLTFLKSFDIDPDEQHEIFGKVSDYIAVLIKQKMIEVIKDALTKKNVYSWGPKAESTVSKMEILNFVSKIYKKKPTSWEKHYESAYKQEQSDKIGENNDVLEV